MPYYDYEDFRKACAKGQSSVVLLGQVLKHASTRFNLKTEKAVLEFIANRGIENRDFINSKEWENNPDMQNPITVDAYEFTSMSRRGYIAFFRNDRTAKWIIKSFHLSSERNKAMEIALRKAGLIRDTE